MKCDTCGGEEQVVRTQEGNFCRRCYPAFKRGRAVPREVRNIRCGNCGELTPPNRRCIRCGNTINRDGSVLRIGGHPNC